jgi:HAMP domain-containing protein
MYNGRMWFLAVTSPTPTIIINNPPSGDGLQTAILALVAVLLGALITGAITFGVAWWRERKTAEAEKIRHAIEVRRAARLIDDDLQKAEAAATYAAEQKEWWFSAPGLSTTGWQEYRAVLAPSCQKSIGDQSASPSLRSKHSNR